MLDLFGVIFYQAFGLIDLPVDDKPTIRVLRSPQAHKRMDKAKVHSHIARPLFGDRKAINDIAGSIPRVLVYSPFSCCPYPVAVASKPETCERFQFSDVTTPLFCPILSHGVVQEWII